jgi:hypothetical protein
MLIKILIAGCPVMVTVAVHGVRFERAIMWSRAFKLAHKAWQADEYGHLR